jgi:hypothetical protein
LATATCYYYSDEIPGRIVIPDSSSCAFVVDCFFGRVKGSGEGGFAYFGASVSYVFVIRCTVHDVDNFHDGGALLCRSDSLEIDECCFNNVYVTWGSGHVLCSRAPNSTLNVNSSSFVDCGDNSSRSGVLFIADPTSFDLTSLNFSECQLSLDSTDTGVGFVFIAGDNFQGDWSFRYCTVLKSSGASGLQHNGDGLGKVAYCNF